MNTPIAFLLYANRSGSTLLAARLSAIPDVAATIESEFLCRLIRHRPHERAGTTPETLADFLLEEPKFAEWRIPRSRLVEAFGALPWPPTLAQITDAVLDLWEPAAGARLRIVKCPGAALYIDHLRAAFPGVRFVHIVRDPRGVYESQGRSISSLTGAPMVKDPVAAALRWRSLLRRLDARRGSDLLEVRYEDLVVEREATLRRLARFLESPATGPLDVEAAFRADGTEYARHIPESQRHLHGRLLVGTDIRTPVEEWRTRLSPLEIGIVDALTRRERRRLRYPDGLAPEVAACDRPKRFLFYTIHAMQQVRRVLSALGTGEGRRRLFGRLAETPFGHSLRRMIGPRTGHGHRTGDQGRSPA